MKIIAIGITKRQKCDSCHTKVKIDIEKDVIRRGAWPEWTCPYCGKSNIANTRFTGLG